MNYYNLYVHAQVQLHNTNLDSVLCILTIVKLRKAITSVVLQNGSGIT